MPSLTLAGMSGSFALSRSQAPVTSMDQLYMQVRGNEKCNESKQFDISYQDIPL